MVISVWQPGARCALIVSLITADDAAGRVKQIEVTGLLLPGKRALDGQRADVLGAGENGLAAGLLKAEIQRSLPAFLSGGNTVPCNVAPLQNQDKTAAMSIDRREFIPVIRNAYVIRNPERRDGREGKAAQPLRIIHPDNLCRQYPGAAAWARRKRRRIGSRRAASRQRNFCLPMAANVLLQKEDVAMIAFDGEEA